MPKLNKSLIASIITDIRELGGVANEMYFRLGKIERLSWKFPTKTAKDINAMEIVEQHEGSAGELYILLLELAYDRIHFLFHLLLEFLNKYPLSEASQEERTAIMKESRNVSLANMIHLVWDRFKIIPEFLERNKMKMDKSSTGAVETACKYTQASCSLYFCESCSLAGDTILRVINAIGESFEENNLISASAARLAGGGEIYEKTQWAVMSRLAAGVEQDVNVALQLARRASEPSSSPSPDGEECCWTSGVSQGVRSKIEDSRSEEKLLRKSRNASKQLKVLRKNYSVVRKEKESLTETLREMESRMQILVDGNKILQRQIGSLAESKMELEGSVRKLGEEVIGARDACHERERELQLLLTELRRENDLIRTDSQHEIECSRRELDDLRREVSECREKEASMNEIKAEFERKIGALENEIGELRRRESSANDARLDLDRKVEEQQAEIERFQRKLEVAEAEAKILREKETVSRGFSTKEKEKEKKAPAAVHGNRRAKSGGDAMLFMPGEDLLLNLTRQLSSNRERMEFLSKQNERSSKTPSWSREYRLPPAPARPSPSTKDPGKSLDPPTYMDFQFPPS